MSSLAVAEEELEILLKTMLVEPELFEQYPLDPELEPELSVLRLKQLCMEGDEADLAKLGRPLWLAVMGPAFPVDKLDPEPEFEPELELRLELSRSGGSAGVAPTLLR